MHRYLQCQQYIHINISGNMLCHDLVAVWRRSSHVFGIERQPRSREEVRPSHLASLTA